MQTNLVERQVSLLVKNWEIVHEIIKTRGERRATLHAWVVTVWWAVLGYAVTVKQPQLLLCLVVFLIIAFLVEASWRMTEDKFIAQADRIETSLRSFALGDPEASSEFLLTTNIDSPGLEDLKLLLTLRRFGFWSPFAALFVLTLYVWVLQSIWA